jgi:hypothetical protein
VRFASARNLSGGASFRSRAFTRARVSDAKMRRARVGRARRACAPRSDALPKTCWPRRTNTNRRVPRNRTERESVFPLTIRAVFPAKKAHGSKKAPRASSLSSSSVARASREMPEEPFVDAQVPRARFAPARPLRTSVLWCSAIGLALMVISMSFALVFDRGFYTQSTATMLAEAASAVPEVRARWAALHLQLSTFAMDAWEDVAGGSEKGESEGSVALEGKKTRRSVSRRALRFVPRNRGAFVPSSR